MINQKLTSILQFASAKYIRLLFLMTVSLSVIFFLFELISKRD